MLRDLDWDLDYTNDNVDTVERFYTPALAESVKYLRGTGYFSADSLVRNVRGIEGLLSNNGTMRLLVGCTLDDDVVDAIRRGEDLKKLVDKSLCEVPLNPLDADTKDGLEILAWMVATGRMEIRVAVRCDKSGTPVANVIYHKKMGLVEDMAGDKIAWNGSDNETPSGQLDNSESFVAFTSWDDSRRLRRMEAQLETDWTGKNPRLLIMDVPEAARKRLLKHAPAEGHLPARLSGKTISAADKPNYDDAWSFIGQSHKMKNGGDMVGLVTAPVEPWPHQVQVFRRLYSNRPARFLIADEVGLGKTIQAGLFLRQAWLEGRRRILVMAPAAVTRQWQKELREKLNLDWPICDGKNLIWQDTHVRGGDTKERFDGRWNAHDGPVIVSSQLARRNTHAAGIAAAPWDVIVLDEAHYARQTHPNDPKRHTPNKMLKLMKCLEAQTNDLILMTATPMQMHPVELYDLLTLLGVPAEWSWNNFERFYRMVRHNMHASNLPFARAMFRASEAKYGRIDPSNLGMTRLQSRNAIRTLAGESGIRLRDRDYIIMKNALLLCSPVARLVSRNTRKHLREYIRDNNLDWRLGTRDVHDEFVTMNGDERRIYNGMRTYISEVWRTHKSANRTAVGFALAIYSKRLTSSLAALRVTLKNHLEKLDGNAPESKPYEDEYDDEKDTLEIIDAEEEALKELDRGAVCEMLDMIRNMPQDTKLGKLVDVIGDLRTCRYKQVMVFTQFTDTMDFLRDHLKHRGWRVMCYSGRHGGEQPGPHGDRWEPLGRDETKDKFLKGEVDVLICTDAAAEGLNFQFCGAMINYDMPWNPMRVEQRIGRIDRIGQKHDTIRIVNMYYKDTIEARIYGVLRERINLFEDVVGNLQPILAKLNDMITDYEFEDKTEDVIQEAEALAEEARADSDFDLDAILAADTAQYETPKSPVTMEDLGRLAGIMRGKMEPAGKGQYNTTGARGRPVRVTTDRSAFEKHCNSMEFWSPGSPAFDKPEQPLSDNALKYETLGQMLDSLERNHHGLSAHNQELD